MTEDEKFEAILRELGELLIDLESLGSKIVLIGGQVLALESLKRGGSGVIAIETDTGVVVDRGFSYEPDLLFDMDGTEFMAGRLPEILRLRGYERLQGNQEQRDFRWTKSFKGMEMHLDLFAPAGVEKELLPTSMTLLPDARLALRRSQRVAVTVGGTELSIPLPDTVAFLTMKERAKREQRPKETRDSFDIFAYIKVVGLEEVKASLEQAGEEGRMLRARLVDLFWDVSADGVKDVVASAISLEEEEKQQLAQAVVDLFLELQNER